VGSRGGSGRRITRRHRHQSTASPRLPDAAAVVWQALPKGYAITLAAGADLTAYGVPAVLTPTHGNHAILLHVFLRIRPPQSLGRMVDVSMTRMMR
jgi:hypothetical protein